MLKPGSRLNGAMFAVTGLLIADARLALAQEQTPAGIQEVVVTAQRREENLQTTPIAITALSAETLNKQGVTDFAGVAEASTSLNFTPYPSSSNTLILYMRGQGVADANQITQDGSVGLYQDGFYISRPQAETFDLADVERVEILRGPQGTLYGRNTTGGAVNLISKKPTGDLNFKFSMDGGSRQYVRALAALDLPKVAGGLSSKVTLLYSNIEGNVHNLNSSGQDYNKENQKGGRASLRWDTGGPFTSDFFFEMGEIDSTPIYYQDKALADPVLAGYPATDGLAHYTWEPIVLPLSIAKYNADGLTLNFKLSDFATLKSLTGYRGLDSRFGQDYASAFTNPAFAFVTGAIGFKGDDIVQSNTFTQEFQLVGGYGQKFDYVAGLYYFQEHANHAENVSIDVPNPLGFIPPGIPIHQLTVRYVHAEAKSKAIYAQGTWHINDPLSLTIGVRYTKDDRSAERQLTNYFNGFPLPGGETFATANNSLNFSKFNPAGTLNYAWTPDINTYLRIATGYKAGGSSEAADVGQFGVTFKPENVTTYELGLKSYWLEHRVRANIAAFYSQFKDMQLQFNTNPNNLAIVLGTNAGEAKVSGAELELLVAPVNNFTFGFDYTYLHTDLQTVTVVPGTVFDPAVNPTSLYTVGQNIAPLFRLPYAPQNIFNINADWTMLNTRSGNLELSLNYRYQDRQYDTVPTGSAVPGSTEFYSIPSYGVLNGKLAWNFHLEGNKTARIAVWGKNITNEKYREHVIGQGANLPSCPLNGSSSPTCPYTYQAVAWAPEASWGVQFQYGY